MVRVECLNHSHSCVEMRMTFWDSKSYFASHWNAFVMSNSENCPRWILIEKEEKKLFEKKKVKTCVFSFQV